MTDVTLDLLQRGASGDNPITQAGRVIYNLRVDSDEFAKRKAESAPLYGGGIDDKDVQIFARMPVFRTVTDYDDHHPTLASDGAVPVWSVLNRAGRAGQTLEEFLGGIELVGVAGGDGGRNSSDGAGVRGQDMSGVIGGLVTIINTGPKTIRNGDVIIMHFPNPASATPNTAIKGSPQIVPQTVPWDPLTDRLNVRALRRALTEPRHLHHFRSPNHRAAALVRKAASSLAVLVLDALLAAGVVVLGDIGVTAAGQAARAAAGAAWRAAGEPRTRALAVLAKALRAPSFGNDRAATYRFFTVGDRTLVAHLAHLLSGDVPLVAAGAEGRAPPGDLGVLFENQFSLLEVIRMVGLADLKNHHRFVLGRALSPGGPGKDLDILLGNPYTL